MFQRLTQLPYTPVRSTRKWPSGSLSHCFKSPQTTEISSDKMAIQTCKTKKSSKNLYQNAYADYLREARFFIIIYKLYTIREKVFIIADEITVKLFRTIRFF